MGNTPDSGPDPADDLARVLGAVAEKLDRYRQTSVDETIAAHDDMYQAERREHYFACGSDAIAIIARAMIQAGVVGFERVLDLPCGSGRVMRHLAAFLPEAALVASDLDPRHVDFCARQFGADPLLSRDDLADVSLEPVDLIWCGSLLTHLPERLFQSALYRMLDWLAPGGIGIFTLHGRWPHRRQEITRYKYMSDEAFAPVTSGLADVGFGYAPYPDLDPQGFLKTYGISISMPSWVLRQIEAREDVRLLHFAERGWDNHQDVLALVKVPMAARPWMYEEQLRP